MWNKFKQLGVLEKALIVVSILLGIMAFILSVSVLAMMTIG